MPQMAARWRLCKNKPIQRHKNVNVDTVALMCPPPPPPAVPPPLLQFQVSAHRGNADTAAVAKCRSGNFSACPFNHAQRVGLVSLLPSAKVVLHHNSIHPSILPRPPPSLTLLPSPDLRVDAAAESLLLGNHIFHLLLLCTSSRCSGWISVFPASGCVCVKGNQRLIRRLIKTFASHSDPLPPRPRIPATCLKIEENQTCCGAEEAQQKRFS